MKATLLLIIALSMAPVARAQDGQKEMTDGMDMMQKGGRLLLEGLMKDVGPMMLELQGKLLDMSEYHLPEVLPNGDIIIRRKVPLETGEDGIDL